MPLTGTVLRDGDFTSYRNPAPATAVEAPAHAPQPLGTEEILWKEAEARGLIPCLFTARAAPPDGLDFDAVRPFRLLEHSNLPCDSSSALMRSLQICPQPILLNGPGANETIGTLISRSSSLEPIPRVLVLDRTESGTPREALSEGIRIYRGEQLAEEAKHRELAANWADLLEGMEHLAGIESQLAERNRSDAQIEEGVRREREAAVDFSPDSAAGRIRIRLREALAEGEVRRAEAGAERARQSANLGAYRETIALLKPAADARLHLRWWTFGFWRSLFAKGIVARWNSLHADAAAAEGRIEAIDEEIGRLNKAAERMREAAEGEIEALYKTQITERCRERDESIREARQRQADLNRQLDACWEKLKAAWDELPDRPSTIDGIRLHQSRHREHHDQFLHESRWADSWLKRFDELPPSIWRRRALQSLNRVTLAWDDWRPLAGDSNIPRFDWLIVNGVGEISAADRAAFAAWTDRLLWCGDSYWPASPKSPAVGKPYNNGRAPSPIRFDEICRRADIGVWREEPDSRIYRIETLPEAERARIEWEPLIDCPAVQIGVVPPDRAHPARLAEVRFPRDYPVARVKCILFDELQTISLSTSSPVFRIEEAPGEVTVRLMEMPAEASTPIGKGIVEESAGCETVAIRFETRAGWNAAAVRSWLKLHLNRPVRRLFSADEPAPPR